jgi:hypothetical protein
MNIRIANAGDQHLSALVGQLGTTKNSKELRSGLNETGVQELYVKTKISTGMFAGKEKKIERATSQQNARVDIMKALYNEFPQAVADKVLTNMKSFFSSKGEVTVADARAILATATATAIEARKAEVQNPHNLFDTQNHPQVAALFSAFTRAEFNSENYDFVQAVRTYKAIPPNANGVTKQVAATAILNQFISESGGTQANLSSKIRNDLEDSFKLGNLSVHQQGTLFDVAEEYIIQATAQDAGRRFIKNPETLNYINNG